MTDETSHCFIGIYRLTFPLVTAMLILGHLRDEIMPQFQVDTMHGHVNMLAINISNGNENKREVCKSICNDMRDELTESYNTLEKLFIEKEKE